MIFQYFAMVGGFSKSLDLLFKNFGTFFSRTFFRGVVAERLFYKKRGQKDIQKR